MNRLPTPDEILAWLRDNPTQTAKRDIARAFGLKGAAKVELKQLLAEMAARRPAREAPPPRPPAGRRCRRSCVLRVTGPDREGDLWAEPADWEGEGAAPAHPGARPAATTRRSAPATGCSAG